MVTRVFVKYTQFSIVFTVAPQANRELAPTEAHALATLRVVLAVDRYGVGATETARED